MATRKGTGSGGIFVKWTAFCKALTVSFTMAHTSRSIALSRVRKDTLLVSVMHVNNETGAIQPVDEIGDALSKTDVIFHIDETQSAGKLVPEIQRLSYRMMSFSGHKMHGPQGIGGLILKKNSIACPRFARSCLVAPRSMVSGLERFPLH